ncbi:uncharacterized protein BCR38DRAFT_344294 [Pseudomassariella vexata]|uniref:Calpain catalytic domain-containing protein n=1 Tax=Pseudomassariella vexata TaxID=1141098 RepID=A0A1Y2DVW5_9PEZI|nr:uncharacterized protein BCR38DRAFT_344294 [Pseudomassariella vexata]ORY63397.1 hypothetical protein BCR38DRAFT_344294 [Pseudomassariella vexata]
MARGGIDRFGYSSSSESEDEKPRKPKPPPNNAAQKNKKKLPPQQSINKIWRHFTTKKATKALSILPFDPVPSPTADRKNELLSVGYERAVEECRQRVRRIIQECKRVNMRYRDPGFDLDWDLKMLQGHCLNYLGSNKFDLCGPRLSFNMSVPKAVKRVHEIFDRPTFLKNVNGGDIKQGNLGNCWLIAGLSALGNVEDGIKRLCVESDTQIGIYGFVFYRDGEWVYSIIDDKLYLTSPCFDSPSMHRDLLQQVDDPDDIEEKYRQTYQTGSKALFFGQNKDQNETWVPLVEKAYAKVHGDFASLTGGWTGEGVEDLSGGVTTELLASDILDLDGFWENELCKVNKEFLFGCSTGLLDGGYGERRGIREGHAYVVMDVRTLKNGERLVKLRNPWGKLKKGIWEGAWSDGSKEWTNDVKDELGHTFGSDSVFWIRYEDMIRKYQHFDRTRLFRESDWRCCQRWIGVEVPWKAQWNEKFHMTLTKESPLVLVLQQLDNRYYKGLHGQYSFRLHFRLHEQGRPDAEDYIASRSLQNRWMRSHGNYLMDRAVSIELPSMGPGHYSVFVKVVGERDTDYPSIESVVQRECKKRSENEKLAQVGYAYDLAHSKGVAHLEHVAKLRKETDRKKASTSRKQERRRGWEKRHKTREIQKKQQKKNKEKGDRRRETEEAERKKKEEAEAAERKVKEAAEEAERKKNEEEQPKDQTILTDKSEAKSGEDKSVQTNTPQAPDKQVSSDGTDAESAANPDTSGSPQNTPSSEASQPVSDEKGGSKEKDADEAPVSGGPSPPPPPPPQVTDSKQKNSCVSESDSSDSPVEDWEELYRSDDMSKKPRLAPAPAPAPPLDKLTDTDDEAGLPDPWNAICIVGFRVYSKDEDLDLRIVIEGGELAEGGMGEKGAQDIDNAQANAGGERKKDTETGKVKDKVEIVDGVVVHTTRMVNMDEEKKDMDENENTAEDGKGEDAKNEDEPKESDDEKTETQNDGQDCDARSDTTDSTDSNPVPTPDSMSGDCTPQRRPDFPFRK